MGWGHNVSLTSFLDIIIIIIIIILVLIIVEWGPFFQKFSYFIVDICNIPFTLECGINVDTTFSYLASTGQCC